MQASDKWLVFQISFLFQSTFAFFNNDDEMSDARTQYRTELKKTFGYNFSKLNEINDVLVWKISKGQTTFKPQDYCQGFTEFGVNETFLIFTQNWKRHFTLYYWVGTEIKLEDKKHVAKYAAIFFILMNKYSYYDKINFTREDKTFESESFIHTINRLRSKPQSVDGRNKVYRDNNFPLNGPNLYLVKDGQTTNGIKIPVCLGLKLLIHEVCLVIEAPPHLKELHPGINYCVAGVNETTLWRAQSIVGSIQGKFITTGMIARGSDTYKVFIQLLEDKQYYRESEINHLQDGRNVTSNQDVGISLFTMSMAKVDGKKMMIREPVMTRPIDINFLRNKKNYIIDTKSVSGIFFAYGEGADMNEIICAIQNAEEYLHDKILSFERPIRMRITSADSSSFQIDVLINEIPPQENNELFRILLSSTNRM